jgi:hypothetical protein
MLDFVSSSIWRFKRCKWSSPARSIIGQKKRGVHLRKACWQCAGIAEDYAKRKHFEHSQHWRDTTDKSAAKIRCHRCESCYMTRRAISLLVSPCSSVCFFVSL